MHRKHQTKKLTISVIGAGVVGQATGLGLLGQGYTVQFVDVNAATVTHLQQRGLRCYLPQSLRKAGDDSDISLLTVSTPTAEGSISLAHIEAAAYELGQRLKTMNRYHLVTVRSTVPPGTTETVIAPILERESGKLRGRDFGLCMNPEYLREKSAAEDFRQPWLIVIGQFDQRSGDLLADLYQGFDCPLVRVSIQEAELQKYAHNLFNATKISFFNEMRRICQVRGLDHETIFKLTALSCEGMWNATYGTRDFGAFDGMCLPKDTQAFYAWATKNGYDMPVLAATIALNDSIHTAASPAPQPELRVHNTQLVDAELSVNLVANRD